MKIKNLIKSAFLKAGFFIGQVAPLPPGAERVADYEFYEPFFIRDRLFSPWRGYGEFKEYLEIASRHSLVSPDRCWVLYSLARQAIFLEGDFWECGVYRGGTAAMFARYLALSKSSKKLHLFDTFSGMPGVDEKLDLHRSGDFHETNLETVKSNIKGVEQCVFHPGFIPQTFVGLENEKISFAHIDVDLHDSVLDSIKFIYPRLVPGGFIVLDDYGIISCPGARKAIDDFFGGSRTVPLVLPTMQAIVFNPPASPGHKRSSSSYPARHPLNSSCASSSARA
jgi:O-methyltransferase